MTSVVFQSNNSQVRDGFRFKLGPTTGGTSTSTSATYFETSAVGNNSNNFGYTTNGTSLAALTNSIYSISSGSNQAVEWVSYFKTDVSGNYTFQITLTISGASGSTEPIVAKLWVGDDSLQQTNINAVINFQITTNSKSSTTYSFDAIENVYYPVRLQFFKNMFQGSTMTIDFAFKETTAGIYTNTLSGNFFYINNGVLRF
jgi:hypothetical protein